MLFNKTRNQPIVQVIDEKRTTISKFLGLMFTDELDMRIGIKMNKVVKVHTFFMNYPIDIFYIDKNNVITQIDRNIMPWRICKLCKDSAYIVETNAGIADRSESEVGDEVFIK